jgi:hypothetical protein
MLHILDFLLSFVHFAIIAFNLFGWIARRTRKAHLVSILLTAASWFILGIWFGTGYCPFTDWQWQVKTRLGETNLPPNFIEYIAEKLLHHDSSNETINILIAVCFVAAAGLSVYLNIISPLRKKKMKTNSDPS